MFYGDNVPQTDINCGTWSNVSVKENSFFPARDSPSVTAGEHRGCYGNTPGGHFWMSETESSMVEVRTDIIFQSPAFKKWGQYSETGEGVWHNHTMEKAVSNCLDWRDPSYLGVFEKTAD